MPIKKAIDGNLAVAEGVRLARVQVIAAYPITPQTPIVETISEYVDKGELVAKYIAVESEHSALSAVVGSALVGARSFTATAGVGLALMHEITGVAAGSRLPLVMAVANRSLPSPWSLQTDHSDSMGERDQGWIQLYAENCQEALDLILVGYRLAEDERVRIPVMVCIDGFYVSHTTEVVSIPDQKQVDRYLPPYRNQNLYLDVDEPFTVNQLTSADVFTEIKYEHYQALENSAHILDEVGAGFACEFGRSYGAFAQYEIENAETVIIAMGSIAGTARQVVQGLREQGQAIGLIKVTSFRPFPKAQLRDVLGKAKKIIVIDRSAGMGSEGPLAMEIKSALYGLNNSPAIYGFCGGLGGRDFHQGTVLKTLDKANELQLAGVTNVGGIWIDLKEV